MTKGGPIFYVQYTNPAAYPPLLHSSRLLADAGCSVRMLGTSSDGAEVLGEPSHPRVRVERRPLPPAGLARRLHYAQFIASALREISRARPRWIYASDPFSTPIAVAAKRLGLARVVYHEHDAPSGDQVTAYIQAVYAARRVAARTADLLVIPNEERLTRLVAESGRLGPAVCVWNCPSLREVGPGRQPIERPLRLYYHGSINSSCLPLELLEAMARTEHPYHLLAVGYETVGSRGYGEQFVREAHRHGLADRIEVRGPLSRHDLMSVSREADVGLSLMPVEDGIFNMRAMAGASNKAFDYLAGGLALLVSDLPDWGRMYVEPGYALSADPRDAGSLADALSRFASDPEATRRMGEAGRRRILDDWNYEAQFAPVLQILGCEPLRPDRNSSTEALVSTPPLI